MTANTQSEVGAGGGVLARLCDAALSRRLTPAECDEFYQAIRTTGSAPKQAIGYGIREVVERTIGQSFSERTRVDLGDIARIINAFNATGSAPAPSADTKRLDWLAARAFTAYRTRDVESGDLFPHATVVDEDAPRRIGQVRPTLRAAIDAAMAAANPTPEQKA